MCVKAVKLDSSEELHLKILNAMFPDEKRAARVNFAELGKQLGVSEEVVRYNVVKKLVPLGYIRLRNNAYEPTDKIVFLKKK